MMRKIAFLLCLVVGQAHAEGKNFSFYTLAQIKSMATAYLDWQDQGVKASPSVVAAGAEFKGYMLGVYEATDQDWRNQCDKINIPESPEVLLMHAAKQISKVDKPMENVAGVGQMASAWVVFSRCLLNK